MTYSLVLPAVKFLARESLENLDHEEVESDHECDSEEEIMMQDPVIEEVDSDNWLEGGPFEEEARKAQRNSKAARQKQKYREKRTAKRVMIQQEKGTTLKAVALKKRSNSGAQGVNSSSNFEEGFIPSKPAWKAMPDVEKDEKEYSLEELVNNFGMTVVDWDGR